MPEDAVMLTANAAERQPAAPYDFRRVAINPNHWYPLAWSRELKPGKTLAAKFAGEAIALVRTASGKVFAVEDRCAHRQVPLSAGTVSGETIRCCYHGWSYDGTGACVGVPYIGENKLPAGVRGYPCREEGGLIFVFPGAPGAAAGAKFPSLGASADPAYKTRRFGETVSCHYSFMHENLMDMNHQFMHSKQMGKMKPNCLGTRVGADWLEVDFTFSRDGRQPWGEAAIFSGKKGELGQNGQLMTIRTEYPYQVLRIWAGHDAPIMHLWIVYVPQDAAQRTNRTFGLLSIRRPKLGFLLDAGWPVLVRFTERIFAEDRWIVEQEQKAHDTQGGNWNQEIFPAIREAGALLARCGAGPIEAA